jgi:hypothetical protein
MTDLRTAALRALKALKVAQDHWNTYHGLSSGTIDEAADMLRKALAQPEDKSQAAFEHWVETVEATQGCAISRNAVADATCKQSLQVEPCNKSCAPGYCYCEPIIKPEIKGHNVEPPPEAQTEAEKIAYCAGWWAAMQKMREQPARPLCKGIPRRGCNYLNPCDTVCNKCGEIHHHHQMVAQFEAAQQPEIKADKEARWLPMPWKGLTEEEHNYYKALGFVGVKAVEEKLRAKNSTLACIPAVPPG